ncbi:MAG: serine/threonine-protein kinase [Planctomycetota bacterium]
MSNSTREPRDKPAAADDELSATQIAPPQLSAGSAPVAERHSGSSPAPPATPMPLSVAAGSYVDRFEICSPLGKGSFGEVWKCRDPLLNRFVAIKFAKPLPATLQAAFGLVEEARKVSQLSHPGIVHIYDVIESGQHVAIVSELVDGQTLKDRLTAGPISIHEVISIVRDVAAGLQHAHQHDLVHRDVKPSNILLRKNGSATLTDFGLAASEVQFEHMQDGSSGTLLFMSPEQARGDIHLLDNRSDIFCLGIVLFHCLTGRFPYPAASDRQKYRKSIATRNARPLRAIDHQLPKALDHICGRCMAFDPRDRYRTAQDLIDDLEAFLASETAPLPSAPTRPRPQILVAAVAVLGLTVATSSLLRSTSADRNSTPTIVAPSTIASGTADNTSGDRQSPNGRKPGEVNLLQPPQIFAWPFSDSRGDPQHSPETQTWSVRSERTRFVAVCGEIDPSVRELNLSVEINLRDWIGGAGLMWGLRRNGEGNKPADYLCYTAEFLRSAPESPPLICVSELTITDVDAQEKQIPFRREIATTEVPVPPHITWATLEIRIKPEMVDVFFQETHVCSPKDLNHPEKSWLPENQSSSGAGLTGRGAMVAFRRLKFL